MCTAGLELKPFIQCNPRGLKQRRVTLGLQEFHPGINGIEMRTVAMIVVVRVLFGSPFSKSTILVNPVGNQVASNVFPSCDLLRIQLEPFPQLDQDLKNLASHSDVKGGVFQHQFTAQIGRPVFR